MRAVLIALLMAGAMALGLVSAQAEQPEQSVFVPHGPIYDQSFAPACVGFAFQAFLDGGAGPHPWQGGLSIYRQAKTVDGYTGDGTWPWAAAQVLIEKRLLTGVRTSTSVQDGIDALATGQGFVIGARWTEGMAQPVNGVITPTGKLAGAHAFFCYGYDATTKQVACQNSWGQGWGHDGTFRINREALQGVVQQDEVVIPRKQWRTPWSLIWVK